MTDLNQTIIEQAHIIDGIERKRTALVRAAREADLLLHDASLAAARGDVTVAIELFRRAHDFLGSGIDAQDN